MFMLRPDALFAFEDKGVQKALGRYIRVCRNERAARFLITKGIAIDVDLSSPSEELWEEHGEKVNLISKFLELKPEEIEVKEKNLLDLKIELANRMLENCNFCERKCNVNRAKGEKGFCGVGKISRLSSEFLHYGEEACLVPSHTFFFIGCNFYCVYCQNWTISRSVEKGIAITPKELASLAKRRRVLEKSRNVNLVGGDPIPHLHTILEMLRFLDTNVPIVWNSNMYLTEEAIKLLEGCVDVYLTDFKYGNNACAERLSKAKNYFDIITRNHLIAKKQAELLIRHLVLPNHIECCTSRILKWIAKNFDNEVRVNIMAQYRPEFEAMQYKDITRRTSSQEMEKAFEIAKELGLWNLD